MAGGHYLTMEEIGRNLLHSLLHAFSDQTKGALDAHAQAKFQKRKEEALEACQNQLLRVLIRAWLERHPTPSRCQQMWPASCQHVHTAFCLYTAPARLCRTQRRYLPQQRALQKPSRNMVLLHRHGAHPHRMYLHIWWCVLAESDVLHVPCCTHSMQCGQQTPAAAPHSRHLALLCSHALPLTRQATAGATHLLT